MTAFGRPAITTPNTLDLRAIQSAVAAARRRIEILEEAVRALETSPVSLASRVAALEARGSSGSGSVSSVGATVPSFMSVSGSPITSTGTLNFNFDPQPRGFVLAGPVAGADAAPDFRTLEWDYDLPLFSSMSFTSGLDGTEIIAVERYGSFSWTTLSDLAALLSTPTFSWRDVPGTATVLDSDMENGISTSATTGTQVITIPAGVSGNATLIYQAGAANVQIVAVSGVTLNVRSGLTAELAGQYAVATLIQRAPDVWFLAGDLAP